MTAHQQHPRVVIVGAGFGGLSAAQALRKAPVSVTVVDQHNYHLFQPLLYQVATAGLEPGDIAQAVRHVLHRQKNLDFRLGTVTGVDWDQRHLHLEDGDALPFDYLILAAGAVTNDFGVQGVAEYAFGLKTLHDASELRNHVLQQFERASKDPTWASRGGLTFVVVGGGPTGVEVSGALIELFDMVLKKDYPSLDVDQAKVVLVEATDRLLAPYAPKLRDYTVEALQKRGVDVRLKTSLKHATADGVELEPGGFLAAQTLVWAAGIKAHPLAGALGLEQTRGGRLVVAPDLSLPGHPEAFVVGDMAASKDAEGNLHPQVATTAMQGGEYVAKLIRKRLEGKDVKPFVYKDLGQMATIGRNAAVVELPSGFKMRGWLAWMAWLLLHLVKLVGFRNRISVMVNWIYNYFTYDRSARLIYGLHDTPQPEPDASSLNTGLTAEEEVAAPA